MTNEITKEKIKELSELIIDKFKFGELITHDWVKHHSGLKEPYYKDYDSQTEFIIAFELYNFAYMSIIDKLRNEILENFKYYLKNVRGDGYVILPPHEQTDFANDKFKSEIRKLFKNTSAILSNVNYEYLDADKRKENADSLARLSKLKHIIKG